MEENTTKKRKGISDRLKNQIKKKPYDQQINGKVYLFSLLRKKGKVIGTNQRLLILEGNQFIGYARQIPQNTLLPFLALQALPRYKVKVPLKDIENASPKDDTLFIKFNSASNINSWQFVCNHKHIAAEWAKKINQAINFFNTASKNVPIQSNISISPQKQINSINMKPNNDSHFKNPQNLSNLQKPEYYPQNNHMANQGLNNQDIPNHQINFPNNNSLQNQSYLGNANQYNNDFLISNQHNANFINKRQQTAPIDYKNSYQMRRKQEEERKQAFMQLEKGNYGSSEGKKNSIDKFERQIEDYQWDYEFAKSQNQFIVIQKFKKCVEAVVAKLVDQLSLEPSIRKYKPINNNYQQLKYRFGTVSIQVLNLQLIQPPNLINRGTVVSSKRIKYVNQELKNANYIIQSTKNKGKFRVPLMMITEYKGITVISRVQPHYLPDYQKSQSLVQDINQFQQDTRISRNVFEDQQNVKVMAADVKYFQRLARTQNNLKNFNICFLMNINRFIPQDFYGVGREDSKDHRLRPQVLADEENDNALYNGGDLAGAVSRARVTPETRDAVNLLNQVSKTMPLRAQQLVKQLQSLEESIANSEELSNFMHLSGINMRYLNLILEYARQPWLRSIIVTEIAARSSKYIIRYDIQDSLFHLNAQSQEQSYAFHIEQLISSLNRLLGIGSETENLWKQIQRQSQTYFKVSINREDINPGFFLQALQYHGGFRLTGLNPSEFLFKTARPLNQNNFLRFIVKSKVYDPSYTELYTKVDRLLQSSTYENYERLSAILGIERRGTIEQHWKLNGFYDRIYNYLVNWISPQNLANSYEFSLSTLPSSLVYQIQLTAMKWELKSGRVNEAQRIRDRLVQHITCWLGQYHPILSQIYDLFSRYFQTQKNEQKRSIANAKAALKNKEKMLGPNHPKIAESYYNIAGLYIFYANSADALSSCTRAAQILQQNKETQSEAYGEIILRLGQIYLMAGITHDALQASLKSYSVGKQNEIKDIIKSSAEIIGRCYQILERWQQYGNFAQDLLQSIYLYKNQEQGLASLLKTLLTPSLHALIHRNKEVGKNIITILRQFPVKIAYDSSAFSYIRSKMDNKLFLQQFLDQMDRVETILRQLETNGQLLRWRGFEEMRSSRSSTNVQFLASLEAINNFLGDNFIEGVLQGL